MFRLGHFTKSVVFLSFVFGGTLFSQDGSNQLSANFSSSKDDTLINQFVQSKGNNIIVFDSKNIKQFWIDPSVCSFNDHIEITLDNGLESKPHKIQLANINELWDCIVEVISETDDIGFSILNSKSKVLSTSEKGEKFLDYSVTSASFHLEDTDKMSFMVKFKSKTADSLSIKRIILSFSENKKSSYFTIDKLNANIEEWNGNIPALNQHNICKNGDFEQVLAGKELENAIARYYKDVTPESFDATACLLPSTWNFDAPSVNGKTGSARLTSEHALAGKYSLEIQNEKLSYIEGGYTSVKDCLLTGFIHANKDSKILIQPLYFNSEKKTSSAGTMSRFEVVAGKTYKFSIPITNTQDIKDLNNMCFVIKCSGHVIMDNIQCLKLATPLSKDH